MATQKTLPTAKAVTQFIAAVEDPVRRADCETLAALMQRVTQHPPTMWGASIVGFGQYAYRYESGTQGVSCRVGFSPRKGDLSIYLMPELATFSALLARLGKHKTGKVCLYVKRLADVDLAVLEALVQASWDEMARRYP